PEPVNEDNGCGVRGVRAVDLRGLVLGDRMFGDHVFLLPTGSFAEWSEARPNFFCEQLRLLPGGEVTAFGDGVEMDEIVVGALGPTPRSLVDLFREDAYGSRNGDVVVVEEGALVFRVEPGAGHARVRQPGKRDVVEDVVPGEVA